MSANRTLEIEDVIIQITQVIIVHILHIMRFQSCHIKIQEFMTTLETLDCVIPPDLMRICITVIVHCFILKFWCLILMLTFIFRIRKTDRKDKCKNQH